MAYFPGWASTAAAALAAAAPSDGLVIDNFAGGGGASTGGRRLLERGLALVRRAGQAAKARLGQLLEPSPDLEADFEVGELAHGGRV